MHLISPEELTSAIADRLARQPAVLVALDGRCGSGKTTLAAQLAERFPQSITVHTDDFYLPPSRRVTGWEKIPCANMDIQRLRDEVVAPPGQGRRSPTRPTPAAKVPICRRVPSALRRWSSWREATAIIPALHPIMI